jgi:hypothetical protein
MALDVDQMQEIFEDDLIKRDLNTTTTMSFSSTNNAATCGAATSGVRDCPGASFSSTGDPIEDQLLFPITTAEAAAITSSFTTQTALARKYKPMYTSSQSAGDQWWLRSQGNATNKVAYVDADGMIRSEGVTATNDVMKQPRLSMFAKIPASAMNIAVGTCEDSNDSCIKMFSAYYAGGNRQDNWAKFDIIGINDGVNPESGTCRLGTSASGAAELTNETAYAGYQLPGDAKQVDNVQCPAGTMQLLMSSSYAFNPGDFRMATRADLTAGAETLQQSCVYVYANAINSDKTGAQKCFINRKSVPAVQSDLEINMGEIPVRWRISEYGESPIKLLQYDVMAWAANNGNSYAHQYHANIANYNAGANKADFIVSGGSNEAGAFTTTSTTPAVCTVDSTAGKNVSPQGKTYRITLLLQSAGTCTVSVQKASTSNHPAITYTEDLPIYSVDFNSMAGTLQGSTASRYFFEYSYTSSYSNGFAKVPSVAPDDPDSMFVGWCWKNTGSDDVCDQNKIVTAKYTDSDQTQLDRPFRVRENATPVAVIRAKRLVSFDYGTGPSGETPETCVPVDHMGCVIGKPDDQIIPDGFGFDQYLKTIMHLSDLDDVDDENFGTYATFNFHDVAKVYGYTFLSWNTAVGCGGDVFRFITAGAEIHDVISADTTLYACYKPAVTPLNCGFKFDDPTLPLIAATLDGEQDGVPDGSICVWNFESGQPIGTLILQDGADITITEDMSVTRNSPTNYIPPGYHNISTDSANGVQASIALNGNGANSNIINMCYGENKTPLASPVNMTAPFQNGINVNGANQLLNFSIGAGTTVNACSTAAVRAAVRVPNTSTIDIKGAGFLRAGGKYTNWAQYTAPAIGANASNYNGENIGTIKISEAASVDAISPDARGNVNGQFAAGAGIGCSGRCTMQMIDISTSGVVNAVGGRFGADSTNQWGAPSAGIGGGAGQSSGGVANVNIHLHGTGQVRGWARNNPAGAGSGTGIGLGNSYGGTMNAHLHLTIDEEVQVLAVGGSSTNTCNTAAAIGYGCSGHTIQGGSYIKILGGTVVATNSSPAADRGSGAAIGVAGGGSHNGIANLQIQIENANVYALGGNHMKDGNGTFPPVMIQPPGNQVYSPAIYPFPTDTSGRRVAPFYVPKTLGGIDTIGKYIRVPASGSNGTITSDYTAKTADIRAIAMWSTPSGFYGPHQVGGATPTDISAVLWMPVDQTDGIGNLFRYAAIDADLQNLEPLESPELPNLMTHGRYSTNTLMYPPYTADMQNNILRLMPPDVNDCSWTITGGVANDDYECTKFKLTIKKDVDLEIADTPEFVNNPYAGHRIVVEDGITTSLTTPLGAEDAPTILTSIPNDELASGIDLGDGANLSLCLQQYTQTNVASTKIGKASIHVPSSATFTLAGIADGCGSEAEPPSTLNVQSGLNYSGAPAASEAEAALVNTAAGIGANPYEGWGIINLNGSLETTGFSTSSSVGGASCWLNSNVTYSGGGLGCPDIQAGIINISGSVQTMGFLNDDNMYMAAASIGGGSSWSGKVPNSGEVNIFEGAQVFATTWEPSASQNTNQNYRFSGAPIGMGGFGGSGISAHAQVQATTSVLDGKANQVNIKGGMVMTRTYKKPTGISNYRTAGIGRVIDGGTPFSGLAGAISVKITSGNVYAQNSNNDLNMSIFPQPVGFYNDPVYPTYLQRFTSPVDMLLAYCDTGAKPGCTNSDPESYHVKTQEVRQIANDNAFHAVNANPGYTLPDDDLVAVMWLPGQDSEEGYKYSASDPRKFIYYAKQETPDFNYMDQPGSALNFGVEHLRARNDGYSRQMNFNIIRSTVTFWFRANNNFTGGNYSEGWRDPDNLSEQIDLGDLYIGQQVNLGSQLGLLNSTLPKRGQKYNDYTFAGWYYEQVSLLGDQASGNVHHTAQSCADYGQLEQVTEESIVHETNDALYGKIVFYGCWLDRDAPVLPALLNFEVPNPNAQTVKITFDSTEDVAGVTPKERVQYCLRIDTAIGSCGTTINESVDGTTGISMNYWFDGITEDEVVVNVSGYGLNANYNWTLFVRDLAGNYGIVKSTRAQRLHNFPFNRASGGGTVPATQYALFPDSITLPNQGAITNPAGATFIGWCPGAQTCTDANVLYPGSLYSPNASTTIYAIYKYTLPPVSINSCTDANPNCAEIGGLAAASKYAMYSTDAPNDITYFTSGAGETTHIVDLTLRSKPDVALHRMCTTAATLALGSTACNIKPSDLQSFSTILGQISTPAITSTSTPYNALTVMSPEIIITQDAAGDVDVTRYTLDDTTPTCGVSPTGTEIDYAAPFTLALNPASLPYVIVKAITCDLQDNMYDSIVTSQTFALRSYTVHFNENTSFSSVPVDQTVYHTGDLNVNMTSYPMAPPAGYTFAGWYSYPLTGAAPAPDNTSRSCGGSKFYDENGAPNLANTNNILQNINLYACFLDQNAPDAGQVTSFGVGNGQIALYYDTGEDEAGVTPKANIALTFKYALEDCGNDAAWLDNGSGCVGLTTSETGIANTTVRWVTGLTNGVTYYFKIIAYDLAGNYVTYPTVSSAVYRIQYNRGAASSTGNVPGTVYVLKDAAYNSQAFALTLPGGVGYQWWCKGVDVEVKHSCPEADRVVGAQPIGPITSNLTLTASYGLAIPLFSPTGATNLTASPNITLTHLYPNAPNIYYTINGSDPTCLPSGTLYTGVFNAGITPTAPTAEVKAIACDTTGGMIANSVVATQTYTLADRTVSFNLMNGLLDGAATAPPNQIVKHGGYVSNPVDVGRLTRAGLNFAGWTTSNAAQNNGLNTATSCAGTMHVSANGTVQNVAITANLGLYACWLDKTAPEAVSGATPTTLSNGKTTTTVSWTKPIDVNNITAQASLQYKVVKTATSAGSTACADGTQLMNWTTNAESFSFLEANQTEGNNYLTVCVRDLAGNITPTNVVVNIYAKATFNMNGGTLAPAGGSIQYFDVSSGSADLSEVDATYSGAIDGWTFKGWMVTPALPAAGWSDKSNSATTCPVTPVSTYPYSITVDVAFVACWLDETAPAQVADSGFSTSTLRLDQAPVVLTIPTTSDAHNVTPGASVQYKVVKSPSIGSPTASTSTTFIADWAAKSGSNFNVNYTVATGLEAGLNYITVYARDLAGNISVARTYTIDVGAFYNTSVVLTACGTDSTAGNCATAVAGMNAWRVDNAPNKQKVHLSVTVASLPAGTHTLSGRGWVSYSNRGTAYSGMTGQNDALSCNAWTQVGTTNVFYCDITLIQNLNIGSASTLTAHFDGDSFDYNSSQSTLAVTPEKVPTKVITSTKNATGKSTSSAADLQFAVVPASCTLADTTAADLTLTYLKTGTNCLFTDSENAGGTLAPSALGLTGSQKYFQPSGKITFKLSATGVSQFTLTCTFNNSTSESGNYEITTALDVANASGQICKVTPKLLLAGITSNAFRSGSTWNISDIIYNDNSPADENIAASTNIASGPTFTISKVTPVITVSTANVAGLTGNMTVPVDEVGQNDTTMIYMDLPANLYASQLPTSAICAALDESDPVVAGPACVAGDYTITTAPSYNVAPDVVLAAAGGLPAKPAGIIRWAYRVDLLSQGGILPGNHALTADVIPDLLISGLGAVASGAFTVAKVQPVFYPYFTATDWDIQTDAQKMHAYQQQIRYPDNPDYGTDGSNPNSITATSITSETTNNKFYVYLGPDDSRGINQGVGPIGNLSAPCTTVGDKVDTNCFESKGTVSLSAYVDTDQDGVLSAAEITAGDIFSTAINGTTDYCKNLNIWDDLYVNDGYGVSACEMPEFASGQYIIRITSTMADTTTGTEGVNWAHSDQIISSHTIDYVFSVGENPALVKWSGSASGGTFAERNAANYAAQIANVYTASNGGVYSTDSTLSTPVTCGDFGSTAITASTILFNDEEGDPVTLGDIISSPEGVGKLALAADAGAIQADGTFDTTPNSIPDIIETLNFERQCRNLSGTLYSYSPFNADDVLELTTTTTTTGHEPTAKVKVSPIASPVTDNEESCGNAKTDPCYSATFNITLPQLEIAADYIGSINFTGVATSGITETNITTNFSPKSSTLLQSMNYAINAESTIPCVISNGEATCPSHKNSYYLRSNLEYVPAGITPQGKAEVKISKCTSPTPGQECNTTTPVTNASSGFAGTYNPDTSYIHALSITGHEALSVGGYYTVGFRTATDAGLSTLAMGKLTTGIYQVCGQYIAAEAGTRSFANSNTNCYRLNVVKAPSTASFDSSISTTTDTAAQTRVMTISLGYETAPTLDISSGKADWKICPSSVTIDSLTAAQNCTAVTLAGVTTSGTNVSPTSASARTFTIPVPAIPFAGSYQIVGLFKDDSGIANTYAVTSLNVAKASSNAVLNNCLPPQNTTGTPTQGITYAENTNTYGTCAGSMLYATSAVGTNDVSEMSTRGLSGSNAFIKSTNKIYMSEANSAISGSLANATLAADSGGLISSTPAPNISPAGKFVVNYYTAAGVRIATSSRTLTAAEVLSAHQTNYGGNNGVAKNSASYGFDVPDSVKNTAGTYYVLACWTGDTGYNFDCDSNGEADFTAGDFGANETTTGTFNFTSETVAQSNLVKMRQISINKAPYGAITSYFVPSTSCAASAVTPSTLDANQYLCIQVVTAKSPDTTWLASALDNNAPGDATVVLKNGTTTRTTKTCTAWTRTAANTYTCLVTLVRTSNETFISTTSPSSEISVATTSIFAATGSDTVQTLSVNNSSSEYYIHAYSDSADFTGCASALAIHCNDVHVRVAIGSDLTSAGVGETGNIAATGDVGIRIEQCDPTKSGCGEVGGSDIIITSTVLQGGSPIATLSSGEAIYDLADALSELDYPAGKYRFSLISYAGDTTFNSASGLLASETIDFARTGSHINSTLTLGETLPGTDISSPETAIAGQYVNLRATVYKYAYDTMYGGESCAHMINDASSEYTLTVKNSANATVYSTNGNLAATTSNCASTPNAREYTIQVQIPQSTFGAAGSYSVAVGFNQNASYTASSSTHTINITKVQPGGAGHYSKLIVATDTDEVATTSLEQNTDIILKVPAGVNPTADNATTPTNGYVQVRYFDISGGGTPDFDTNYATGFNSANIAVKSSDKAACPAPAGADLGLECYYIENPLPRYINTPGDWTTRARYIANNAVDNISDNDATTDGGFEVVKGETSISADAISSFDMLNASSTTANLHLLSSDYVALGSRPVAAKQPTLPTNGVLHYQIWTTAVEEGTGLTIRDAELRNGQIAVNDTAYTNNIANALAMTGEMGEFRVPLGVYARPGEYVLRYAFCADDALEDADLGAGTCADAQYINKQFSVTMPPSFIKVEFNAQANGHYCEGSSACLAGDVDGSQIVNFFVPQNSVIGTYPESPGTPYQVPDLEVDAGYRLLGYTTVADPTWVLDDQAILDGEVATTWADLAAELPDTSAITFYAQYSNETPQLTVDKDQYLHEEEITVEGSGFAPNQLVNVGFSNGGSVEFVPLGTITTDELGCFTLEDNIPGLASINAGFYRVIALDARSANGVSVGADISVEYDDGVDIEIVHTLEDVVVEDEVAFVDGGANSFGNVNLTSNIKMSAPEITLGYEYYILYTLSYTGTPTAPSCDSSTAYDDNARPAMALTKARPSVIVSAIQCDYVTGDRSNPVTKTFTLNTYTLSFNGSGGTLEDGATMDDIEIAQDDVFELPDNAFTAPEGMENFLGWATSAGGAEAQNPDIAYSDGEEFTAPATDVALYAIWKPLPDTPESYIHYIDEALCGFLPHTEYEAGYTDIIEPAVLSTSRLRVTLFDLPPSLEFVFITDGAGCKVIDPQWFGRDMYFTQSITYGTGVRKVKLTSYAQNLSIPGRPDSPQAVVESHETATSANDGIISGVDESMEYRLCEGDACTGVEQWSAVPLSAAHIDSLRPGTYELRVKAVHNEIVAEVLGEATMPSTLNALSYVHPQAASLTTSGNFASESQMLTVLSADPVVAATGTSPWSTLILLVLLLVLATLLLYDARMKQKAHFQYIA